MHDLVLTLDGSWRVLLAGLLLGAGLPALFAVAVRQLAVPTPTGSARRGWRAAAHRTAGALCLAAVLATVALGLTYLVASSLGRPLGR